MDGQGMADRHLRPARLVGAPGRLRRLRPLLFPAERLPVPPVPSRRYIILRHLQASPPELPKIPPLRKRAHHPTRMRVHLRRTLARGSRRLSRGVAEEKHQDAKVAKGTKKREACRLMRIRAGNSIDGCGRALQIGGGFAGGDEDGALESEAMPGSDMVAD
jgi:hypothetical protein